MKITLLTKNLQTKLSFLNHAISNKNQLPILQYFLIKAENNIVSFSATDLEIGIETKFQATILEEGATTVPAKTFIELINSLTDESVTIETKDSLLEVVSKKTKSVFSVVKSEEFPSLYEEKGEKIATLSTENIQKEFSSVCFSASTDISRPALSGVLVRREQDGFLLVATDGFRLSLKHNKTKDTNNGEELSFIVPSRVFKELIGIKEPDAFCTMYISEGSNQVLFEQGETIVIGRLIEADFPPFEKIIPSDCSASITFDREEMAKAVKICSIFARDGANLIKFEFKKDTIIVSSSSSQAGENTVTVEGKLVGEENEIAFNARYLLDFFANVSAKEMTFEMIGPLNPGVFTITGDKSFLHLIMPIRVQE
jgi:DNA polymerase III subunit beta